MSLTPRAAKPPAAASPGRSLPLYLTIQRYVQELIDGPDYGPGDNIPSERLLAERLGANRMTVRKAIDRLVTMGLLERNSTSGTRIPRPRVARPLDPRTSLGISRLIQGGGGEPGSRLLGFDHLPANENTAIRLHLPEGSPLIVIRRLWTVDAIPFCIETSHIPAARVPGLSAKDLADGQSLHGLMRARYGVDVFSGEREIGLARCTEAEAGLLRLSPGDSGLVLRLINADGAGQPLEYLRSLNHPQLVVFRTAPLQPQGRGAAEDQAK